MAQGRSPACSVNDSSHHADQVTGWVVFAAFTVLYLLTASQQYDLDVIGELGLINRLSTPAGDPAHPLYVWLGVPFYRLWLAFGYTGDSLRAMQVLNALFGGASIGLLYAVPRAMGVARAAALAAASCVAVSYAFWTHTVDAFFIVPACFFALLSLRCALALRTCEPSIAWLWAGALGLSFALAVLAYQNNALLLPALLVTSWCSGRRACRWFGPWLLVVVVTLAVLVAAWMRLSGLPLALQGVADLPRWLLGAHGGMARGLWRREGIALLPTILTAWGATVFPLYEGMRLRALARGEVTLAYLPGQITLLLFGLAAIFAGIGVLTKRVLPSLWGRKQNLLAALLWFIVPGAAVAWFDPAEVKLWLIPMLGVWLVVGELVAVLASHASVKSECRVIGWAIVVLPVMLAFTNWSAAIGPNHREPSAGMRAAREVLALTSDRDLLLSSTFDWTAYVRYLDPDRRVVNAIAVAQSVPVGAELDVSEAIRTQMDKSWAAGGRVYLMPYFFDQDDPIWSDWVTPNTGLTRADFSDLRPGQVLGFGEHVLVEGILP